MPRPQEEFVGTIRRIMAGPHGRYGHIQNNRVFSGLLQQLLAVAERQILESPARSRYELLIAQAHALIREQAGCLTVAELAAELHVSRSHLRHIFANHGEQSPAELITRARETDMAA